MKSEVPSSIERQTLVSSLSASSEDTEPDSIISVAPSSRHSEGPLSRRQMIARELTEAGVLAIVRLESGDGLVEGAKAVARGGCRAIEVSLSVPGAADLIARIRQSVPQLLVGAGTVMTVEEVDRVVSAGAKFLVSPITDPAVIEAAHDKHVPILTGCQTPTEMVMAQRLGADFVKLFPADHLPPRYLKNILAPLPELRVIPTGGIGSENAAAWIKAGAAAVGVASSIFGGDALGRGNGALLESRAASLQKAVAEARKEAPLPLW